jgi:peptidyl-prolyl cis-trans isomerase D
MRNDFKKYSWTLWLVIFAFVGGFVAVDAFRGGPRDTNDMIFIGDTTINVDQYQKQLWTTLRNYKAQFKDNFNKRMITQFGIPDQVLQQVVNTTIMQVEADKLNITATEDELKEKILTLPAFQRDGKFIGVEGYQLILAHNRIKVDEFESDLKKEIVLEKFRELITDGLVVDNDTLKEKFTKEKDSADLQYILLKPTIIKDKIEAGDDQIKTYYEEHKEDFKSPEQRAGSVVALKFDDYKTGINLEYKDLFDYYRSNQAQYVEQAKTKVSRILLKYNETNSDEIYKKAEELQKELTKENFARKSKEISEDAKAKDGGDYGYYGWQNFTQQEKSIIESLNENQVYTPVNTGSAYSLLMVTEKIEKKQKEFDKVKDMIRDTLEKKRLDDLVQNKLQALHGKVQNLPDMKEKAEKLGFTVVETGLLKPGDTIKEVDEQGYVSRQLFQLKQNEVGTPIRMQKGMALVQLLQIKEPEVEPLDKVKDRVKNEVTRVKKLERLLQKSKTIAAELNNIKDEKKIEKYLEDQKLRATTAAYRRGNRLGYLPVKKGLDDLIFSMEENRYSGPIDLKTEVAIVKVKSKKITGAADFEKERPTFYTQKLDEMKNGFFASYISNKRDAYDVRVNQELYQKVKDNVLNRFN